MKLSRSMEKKYKGMTPSKKCYLFVYFLTSNFRFIKNGISEIQYLRFKNHFALILYTEPKNL